IKEENGTFKLNLHHPGLMSIKKLRLVHAMIRYRLRNKMYDVSLGEYDIAILGFPINQEDMVFAVHTFSLEIIEGLREMRIDISDEEAETYFQCWKIIGRGLGVDKELEPTSYADAISLQNLIYKRHFTLPNEAGPILSTALMNWFVSTVPLLGEKLLVTFIKEFNGPENYSILSDNLKINIGNVHPDLKAHLADDLHFDEKQGRPGLLATSKEAKAMDNFFLHFIRTLITVERGGKNEHFRVGDGFSASWDLNNMDEKSLPKWKVILLAIWTVLKKLFKSNSNQPSQAN
ncbi:MAG TPA: oxygenase MpaB family protein, partial [Saprospiraceae bacterium]|nr:oxygenase MpaB family protein [Saprospiraceae bacterium]